MPMDRSKYPPTWKVIAEARKTLVGWKCEECGRPCRMPKEPLLAFMRRIGAELPAWAPPKARDGVRQDIGINPQAWTLTVHHPHGDTENPDARLEVLCSGCHLRADAKRHAGTRATNRRRKHGQTVVEAIAK